MTKITKAIIPAAGLGTRFLPQTKAMPKEMLPIIDKPVVQLAIEELVEAGVTDIIIVTGQEKRAIEDHFDESPGLEQALIKKGKDAEARQIREIANLANFVYLRQKGSPVGLARPIENAMHLLGDEPFFVYLPDDFYVCNGKSAALQMLEAYEANQCPVYSMEEIPRKEVAKYGVIDPGEEISPHVFEFKGVVEKPRVEEAPSNYISTNGFILTPDFLPFISKQFATKKDVAEIAISDVAPEYMAAGNKIVGCLIQGAYYDCGSKQGYIRALVDAAKRQGFEV